MIGKGKEREVDLEVSPIERPDSKARDEQRSLEFRELQGDSNAAAGPSRLNKTLSNTFPDDEIDPDCATKEEVLETLGFINKVSAHTAQVRTRIAEARLQAEAMQQHLLLLRTTKRMMKARRQRIQAFVESYERQPRKLPYETLWGPQNGRLIVNTRATEGDHHKELWMSESELESWGVDISQIPDHKAFKEAMRNPKRSREEEEDELPVRPKRQKVELLEGVFVL